MLALQTLGFCSWAWASAYPINAYIFVPNFAGGVLSLFLLGLTVAYRDRQTVAGDEDQIDSRKPEPLDNLRL
jgi:hypothetical protein